MKRRSFLQVFAGLIGVAAAAPKVEAPTYPFTEVGFSSKRGFYSQAQERTERAVAAGGTGESWFEAPALEPITMGDIVVYDKARQGVRRATYGDEREGTWQMGATTQSYQPGEVARGWRSGVFEVRVG